MYNILYIRIAIIFLSCKSFTIAQGKKIPPIALSEIKKQRLIPIPDKVDPNAIHLTAEIYEITKDFKVCDRNYKVAILVKIKIVSNGFGIVNTLTTGQKLTLGIHKRLLEKTDWMSEKIKIGHHVSAVVRERLCIDANIPSYEIISPFYRD